MILAAAATLLLVGGREHPNLNFAKLYLLEQSFE